MKNFIPFFLVILIAFVVLVEPSIIGAPQFVGIKMAREEKLLHRVTDAEIYAFTVASQCFHSVGEYKDCCNPICLEEFDDLDLAMRCTYQCGRYLTLKYTIKEAGTYPAMGTYATDIKNGEIIGEKVMFDILIDHGDETQCRPRCIESCPQRASWWPKKFECKQACQEKCNKYILAVKEKWGRLFDAPVR